MKKSEQTISQADQNTIDCLNGYAKVLKQLARELPKYGADKSFQDTLKGIGSKLLYIGVSSSFRS